MSARGVTLFRAAFDSLREGRNTISLPDDDGQRVYLFTKRVWSSNRIPTPQPSLVLSCADLDLIERQPEGLVVADTTGTTGWTVRMGSS